MDPALCELLRTASDRGDEEIEAIIRLDRPHVAVEGVRIISRFGPIATCRLRIDSILRIRAEDNVESLKLARSLKADDEPENDDASLGLPLAMVDGDERRPRGLPLTGAGIVIGIVDWGCDFDYPSFKRPDGSTRLIALWDQRGRPRRGAPSYYGYGTFYGRRQIDRALSHADPYGALGYHPADADKRGFGTHGTHCMDIAAGNGLAGGPVGVAPQADLIFVHLANRATAGLANLGDSVRILEAVDCVARIAGHRPWVVNLSVGNHGGPHDGRTPTELAFDFMLRAAPNRCIVNSAGNYCEKRIHASGRLQAGETRTLGLLVDKADVTPNELELWYSGGDQLAVRAESPAGARSAWVRLGEHTDVVDNGDVVGQIYNRASDPYNLDHVIEIFLYPGAPPGLWSVTLKADTITDGVFHAWLERDDACSTCQTRFRDSDSDSSYTTGTLANSREPLVVGAYDAHSSTRQVAPFSSCGPTRDGRCKPDLSAPGVGVLAARSAPYGGRTNQGMHARQSGTSMAAPHVTGAVALCLQGAKRPLWNREIRDLLLSNTEPAAASTACSLRLGHGYLDVAKVVDAVSALPSRVKVSPAYWRVGAEKHRPRTKEGKMKPNALEHLDRLKLLVQEPAPRAASERRLLAEITRTSGIPLDSLDPDELYREIVLSRSGPLSEVIEESFTVLARPGEGPTAPPRAGDVLLRVALGHRGLGHVALLLDGRLRSPEQLANAPFPSESSQPGYYAAVLEGGAFPHTRFARRILDPRGRMPPGALLLRARTLLTCAEDLNESLDLAEQVALQHITHAGPYRLAYDRLTALGVIEPLPGRNARRFRGTAALQTALNSWAPYIQKVMQPPSYILTGGLYVNKHGEHGRGNAIDIDGFWWSSTSKFLANDATTDWLRYLTIEATLRKVFGTVLNYDYNVAHHDHWHCDLGKATTWRSVSSQAKFAQRALNEIWRENLSVDGQWGSLSRTAARRNGYDFSAAGGWNHFLDDIINRQSTPPAYAALSRATTSSASDSEERDGEANAASSETDWDMPETGWPSEDETASEWQGRENLLDADQTESADEQGLFHEGRGTEEEEPGFAAEDSEELYDDESLASISEECEGSLQEGGEYEEELELEEEARDLVPADAIDEAAAQPAFPQSVRDRLEPLLDAKRARDGSKWNSARHPARSGIDAATLQTRFGRYLSITAIEQAMRGSAELRDLADDRDAVLAVAAHQFQQKIYASTGRSDGKIGEGTLDALGFVRHRDESLNPADEQNEKFHVEGKSKAFKRLQQVYRADKDVFQELGPDVSPETWYRLFVNAPFLGRPFTRGIHVELMRRLRRAEQWLLGLPAYRGMSPVQLGKALEIDEDHRGGRAKNNSSMHTLGLAVDICYTKNPWVAGQSESPNRNESFQEVTRNVSWLLGGQEETVTPQWLYSLGADPGRTTESAYLEILKRQADLQKYLSLEHKPDQLKSVIQARTAEPDGNRFLKPAETVDRAVERWRGIIKGDRRKLQHAFGSHRKPEAGFMNLHRDLVVALRDHGCLAWGAIDLGRKQSGDMMHFDCRASGIGWKLALDMQRTTGANHPCGSKAKSPHRPSVPESPPGPAPVARFRGGHLWTFTAATLPVRVAVFCPKAASSLRAVDVLVYAHGLISPCPPLPKALPEDLITKEPFELGKLVDASNRAIILIVPFLDWGNLTAKKLGFGWKSRRHALARPANLNGLVAEVLAETGRVQGIAAPSLQRLVLAGHSRAYDFLDPLAGAHADPRMSQGALARLSEVWAFDTTYTCPVDDWKKWLASKPRLTIDVFYRRNSRTEKSGDIFREAVKGSGGRLRVTAATDVGESHCLVPVRRLPALLARSGAAPGSSPASEDVGATMLGEQDAGADAALRGPALTPPSSKAASPGYSIGVVDSAGKPLANARWAIYQDGAVYQGTFDSKGWTSLVQLGLTKFDGRQPFRIHVEGHVCSIVRGATLLSSDPAVEYGGQFLDWSLADAPTLEARAAFWQEYALARKQRAALDVFRFLQHDHVMRRPVRLLARESQATFEARPIGLRLGPLVRYADERRALVWMELQTPGLVRIHYGKATAQDRLPLGPDKPASTLTRHAATVRVGGRHYALVCLDRLEPDTVYLYSVELGPLPATGPIPIAEADFTEAVFPRSLPAAALSAMATELGKASFRKDWWLFFRTMPSRVDSLRFAHGSCRKWPGDADPENKVPGPDMLEAFGSEWLAKKGWSDWPRFFLHSGDQIYADDVGVKQGRAILRHRFAASPPGPAPTSKGDVAFGAWSGRFGFRYHPLEKADLPARTDLDDLRKLRPRVKHNASHDIDYTISEALRARKQAEAFRRHEPAREELASRPVRFKLRVLNALLWHVPDEASEVPRVDKRDGLRTAHAYRAEGPAGREYRVEHPSAGETEGVHAADYAEYAALYEQAWSTPSTRKALAHVPSYMIFDDHEVTDDWNADPGWTKIVHSKADPYQYWPTTMTDALAAYWVYQGWGNLSPEDWKSDPRVQILDRCKREGRDALPDLRRLIFSRAVQPTAPGGDHSRKLAWHYALPTGAVPFLVIDLRTDRDVNGSGGLSAQRLAWIEQKLLQSKSPVAFIALAVPFLMPDPMLFAFRNPWFTGRVARARSTVAFKRGSDLEHPAENPVWDQIKGLLGRLQRSSSLKTIVMISGDIHFSCNLDGQLPNSSAPPRLLQLVSSGLQQQISTKKQDQLISAYRGWLHAISRAQGVDTHRGIRITLGGLHGPGGKLQNFLFQTSVAMVDLKIVSAGRGSKVTPVPLIVQTHLTRTNQGALVPYRFRHMTQPGGTAVMTLKDPGFAHPTSPKDYPAAAGGIGLAEELEEHEGAPEPVGPLLLLDRDVGGSEWEIVEGLAETFEPAQESDGLSQFEATDDLGNEARYAFDEPEHDQHDLEAIGDPETDEANEAETFGLEDERFADHGVLEEIVDEAPLDSDAPPAELLHLERGGLLEADQSSLEPGQSIVVDGQQVRTYADAVAWYTLRRDVLDSQKRAFAKDESLAPDGLDDLIVAANARIELMRKLGLQAISDGHVEAMLGWRDVYLKVMSECDSKMETIAADRFRATRAALARLKEQATRLQPQLREFQRSAFRKGDKGRLKQGAETFATWLDSALVAEQWVRDAVTKLDDIKVLGTALRTQKALHGSSQPWHELMRQVTNARVAKLLSVAGGLNKALAAWQLFDASLAVISGGKTSSHRTSAGISLATTVASAGGTLLGASGFFSLYNNLYIGPMVTRILGQIDQLKDRLSTGRNRPYIQLGYLDHVDWSIEPGGREMYEFMHGVMRARSASDIKTIPAAVGKYFSKHQADFDAGTPKRHGVDIDYADFKDKRDWIFGFRDDIWGMLYGAMSVP